MPSKGFEVAVRAELAAAQVERKRIEAHIIRLSAFLGEAPPPVKRGPGRPKGNGRAAVPIKSLGSLKTKPFHTAVRELLQQYKGGLNNKELAEELTKRGVKIKGKARLSTRVALAVSQFRKSGKVRTDNKTHIWIEEMPKPVRGEGVRVLSAAE